MLADPQARKAMVQSILADSTRVEFSDAWDGVNPLDQKFFRAARVNLQVPVLNPDVTRQCLVFLRDEIGGLIERMDQVSDKRSKSLLVDSTLRRWSQAFSRKMRGK